MRQEIAEAAGCTEEQGCVPAERGPLGAPFKSPPKHDGTIYPKLSQT